ncbi:Exosome complex exonuclease RRP44 isoform X1 [Oopsacas minuta]|uniref:Protein DIS3 homolog n=1 Tax=Oopsacas minuta TaxID=111878 RepID=A0AAV7JUZ3_9METZ|nr:Exosome complex exonuclease RRP44 isoform X1 [Oopsacas minuta]
MFRKQNTYVKKTRSGGILKIVKEHYIRGDIWCGVIGCRECKGEPVLDPHSAEFNTSIPSPYLIVVDTNVVLHHPDFLENNAIHDVIVPQSVQEEVKHRNQMSYKRLRQIIDQKDGKKRFHVFLNKHHSSTFSEQVSESANDYNDRLIRLVCAFYQQHVNEHATPCNIILLSDDKENRDKAVAEHSIQALSTREYIHGLGEKHHTLLDYLSTVEGKDLDIAPKTKIIYPEYLKLSLLKAGIRDGNLLQGVYEANRNNYQEGYVSCKINEDYKEMLISGVVNINRAIHGDVVVVETFPEEEWRAPSGIIKEDNTIGDGEEIDEDLKDVMSNIKKTMTGKIVGILEQKRRQFCGVIQYSEYFAHGRHHMFIPDNKAIQKVCIETRQIDTLKGQRIVVKIDTWPRTSRYPEGHLVRMIGTVGDKDVENEVIMLEHDIIFDPFPNSAIKELPAVPWTISEAEYARRRDLRHIPVCSVDPPSCTDIDDALHCIQIPETNLVEIGVHIADVSHFIRPNSVLDTEAARRGTTVYLADKRIDMVPGLLSTNLCSLREGEERLAFSVIWKIDPETAGIIDTIFTKSVIQSKAALSYEAAQERIDDVNQNDVITQGLRQLNAISKKLKQKRIDNGALILASPEVRFQVDTETHEPINLENKKELDTNSMVEEFMLLANVSTAKKTYEFSPNCAILRRHPEPPDHNYKPLLRATESRGLTIDTSSAKALSESLQSCTIPNNPFSNTLLKILTTRCMQQAKYFCSGTLKKEEFYHFGLANEIYTHFTSPIRRYPDILVHRLLASAIGVDPPDSSLTDEKITKERCDNCNFRHTNAQRVGRASVELTTVLLLKGKTYREEAYVTQVKKNAIRVLVPKYGYEGFVFFEIKDTGVSLEYNDDLLKLTINETVTISVFDRLVVEIKVVEPDVQHQRIQLKLVEPFIKDISVSPTDCIPMDTSMDSNNNNNNNDTESKPLPKRFKNN